MSAAASSSNRYVTKDSSMGEEETAPSLPELVEQLGTGFAQLRVALIAGAVWFADGAELLLISSVTDSVAEEWKLTGFEQGLVVSLVYMGVFLGNLVSGPLGDAYGRRAPILYSFWLIFAFSLCSAASWAFYSLCFFRVLVGVSFGLGQPACQALVTETTPSESRVLMYTICFCLFSLGEVYSAVLIGIDDPDMENLHWRWLLVFGALPAAVFGMLATCFLNQSPFYLSCHGNFEEARVVLRQMARDNSIPDMDVTFNTGGLRTPASQALDPVGQWSFLFGGEMWLTTVVMIFTCFVLNFTFYGCLYAFPNVMTDVDLGSTAAMSLILGALVEVGGLIAATFLAASLPRKTVMKIYLALNSAALLSFAVAANGSGPVMASMRFFGYYGIKCFTFIGFIVAYLYVAEVYPTVCRATGTSVCLAFGRLGAILSSVVFEELEEITGKFTIFFYLTAAAAGLNFVLVSSLAHETQGMMLTENPGEALKAAPVGLSRRMRRSVGNDEV